MKTWLIGLALSTAVAPAFAASDFSCEKIKEKSVRSSCIAARDDAAKNKKDLDDAAEAKRVAAESRRAELDEFVAKSKRILTQSYKDPQGAQFTELVVAESKVSKALCGTVNGRNSYGGYVGPKKFYVAWWTDPAMQQPPRVWTEGESSHNYRRSDSPEMLRAVSILEETEARGAKSICDASDATTVIPIM